MKSIAILGPTASGKTGLSIELASKFNANILSLDSLSIYKEIDIASAKPTFEERRDIKHFGIDEIFPDESFNISLYFDIYKKALFESEKDNKNLIIVGGTGFYLKSLLVGLSKKPSLSEKSKKEIANIMQNLDNAYEILLKHDKEYAQKISKNDTYRIEKWFDIFIQTGLNASDYFANNKQEPLIKSIDLFDIEVSKEELIKRVSKRTAKMVKDGLIDEVVYLEKSYTRAPKSLKSIGIIETFQYLDGILNKTELADKIVTNTLKLAKRQKTFNSTQFAQHEKGDLGQIFEKASNSLISY